jgi:magnesium chelatase subunit H
MHNTSHAQAVETYVLDADMAETLRSSNPQAYRNVLRRCIEAAGRGLWSADPALLRKLQEQYGQMDDELEGVK